MHFTVHRFTLAACALSLLLVPALATGAPIVQYSFPDSWDGVGAPPQVVTDLSPQGNDGTTSGGAALSANIPPGATAGAMSLNSVGEGGVLTDNINLLENPTIAAAGGFRFHAWFYWDGNEGNRAPQKIIDNEGTESLQLSNVDAANDTADLEFRFNDNEGITLPVVANTWYEAKGIFDTQGNSLGANGELSGIATLIANGVSTSGPITRETSASDVDGLLSTSDELDRPIAVGVLALPAVPTLVNFSGDIFDPSVKLGIPEPATLLLALAACCALATARRW